MKPLYYESARQIVQGKARFVDDIPPFHRELKAYIVTSPVARGRLKSFDLSQARAYPGVVAVLSHKDIPGSKKIGVVEHDQPLLVEDQISYMGEPMFLIVAESYEAAHKAAKLIKADIEPEDPVITIEQAIEKDWKLAPSKKIERGDIDKGFAQADHIVEGIFRIGGQEHWYLETHAAIAVPGEENEMKIYTSSQHPTENQHIIAQVLGINFKDVDVEVRRLGGAFGGKEAQASWFAALAALAAWHTKRPVRLRLERMQDQAITGKRHAFLVKYKVGFSAEGKIIALDIELNGNAGAYKDLSMPILERAMFHSENAYYIPNIRIIGTMWRTNLPPNTAFRGFGGPQGIASIENIIHIIAHKLKKDPTIIRKINFYDEQHNETPYGQKVENNRLHILYDQIISEARYFERKEEISRFNSQHKYLKRGLALIPVKFGISFTNSILNQAGALVNVYTDGTVQVNHGGIEMGQGLYTKILGIASKEFGISPDRIRITATDTSKVPNTVATAASTGSDLNGMAVADAIEKIKLRMAVALSNYFNRNSTSSRLTYPSDLVFEDNYIYDRQNPERRISFAEAAALMFTLQVSMSATGYYHTPGIFMDWETGKGHPFYYYSFGMGVVEVELDLLTGKARVIRADLLHDVGESLNPEIDRGQIEGAFVQGMGWTLLEDLRYTPDGRLLNSSPDTYKIPAYTDAPAEFNVKLLKGFPQPGTIHHSKAIGEPPFMYGIAPWLAVKDILAELTEFEKEPDLELPATNDRIVLEVEKLMA